jgi:hypothetical protein
MRRGSMRAREGSHLYWKSASLRRPNQKRSDLFNPPLSKNPYHLKDLQPAELLASVDARLFLPRPRCSQIPLGPVRAQGLVTLKLNVR